MPDDCPHVRQQVGKPFAATRPQPFAQCWRAVLLLRLRSRRGSGLGSAGGGRLALGGVGDRGIAAVGGATTARGESDEPPGAKVTGGPVASGYMPGIGVALSQWRLAVSGGAASRFAFAVLLLRLRSRRGSGLGSAGGGRLGGGQSTHQPQLAARPHSMRRGVAQPGPMSRSQPRHRRRFRLKQRGSVGGSVGGGAPQESGLVRRPSRYSS